VGEQFPSGTLPLGQPAVELPGIAKQRSVRVPDPPPPHARLTARITAQIANLIAFIE